MTRFKFTIERANQTLESDYGDDFHDFYQEATRHLHSFRQSGYQTGRMEESAESIVVELVPPAWSLEDRLVRISVEPVPTRIPFGRSFPIPRVPSLPFESRMIEPEPEHRFAWIHRWHNENRQYLSENSAAHWGSERTTDDVLNCWLWGTPAHNRHGSLRTRNYCLYSYDKLIGFVYNGIAYVLNLTSPNHISNTTTSHVRAIFHATRRNHLSLEWVTPRINPAYTRFNSRQPESRQHAFCWPDSYGIPEGN